MTFLCILMLLTITMYCTNCTNMSIGLEVSSFLLAVGIELITSCLVMRLLPSSSVRAVSGEIEYVCIARMNIYVDHRPRGGERLPRERSRRVEDQQDRSPVRGRDACM